MGENNDVQEQNSTEEVKTKAEVFAEDPDRFVDTHTLIVAVGRSPKGMTILFSPRDRKEAIRAKAELDIALIREIIKADAHTEATKNRIVQPRGGIINFARGKGGRVYGSGNGDRAKNSTGKRE